MKGFEREDRLFSLCGLNCGLCPMQIGGYCPGCGGGEGNQSCAIARCSLERDRVEYCFQCGDYPCSRYERLDEYDSFITHRNRKKDMLKAQEAGSAAYGREQAEKAEILRYLLEHYNDGRKKNFYCVAVNLLELEDIRNVMRQIAEQKKMRKESGKATEELSEKERSAFASELFRAAAAERGIELKLKKKPAKKK